MAEVNAVVPSGSSSRSSNIIFIVAILVIIVLLVVLFTKLNTQSKQIKEMQQKIDGVTQFIQDQQTNAEEVCELEEPNPSAMFVHIPTMPTPQATVEEQPEVEDEQKQTTTTTTVPSVD